MRHVVQHNQLSEQVFFILLSIAREAKHGYLILKEVETLSGGRLKLSTGTLYGAIHRMIEDNWIVCCDCPEGSREKRCYQITELGRDVLEGEHQRMMQLTKVFRTALKAREA